jgi:hypothetical protein
MVNDTLFIPHLIRFEEDICWKLSLVYFPYNEPPSIHENKRPENIVLIINQEAEYHSGPPSADTVNSEFQCEDERFFDFAVIKYDSNHGANLFLKPTKIDSIG